MAEYIVPGGKGIVYPPWHLGGYSHLGIMGMGRPLPPLGLVQGANDLHLSLSEGEGGSRKKEKAEKQGSEREQWQGGSTGWHGSSVTTGASKENASLSQPRTWGLVSFLGCAQAPASSLCEHLY